MTRTSVVCGKSPRCANAARFISQAIMAHRSEAETYNCPMHSSAGADGRPRNARRLLRYELPVFYPHLFARPHTPRIDLKNSYVLAAGRPLETALVSFSVICWQSLNRRCPSSAVMTICCETLLV